MKTTSDKLKAEMSNKNSMGEQSLLMVLKVLTDSAMAGGLTKKQARNAVTKTLMLTVKFVNENVELLEKAQFNEKNGE